MVSNLFPAILCVMFLDLYSVVFSVEIQGCTTRFVNKGMNEDLNDVVLSLFIFPSFGNQKKRCQSQSTNVRTRAY